MEGADWVKDTHTPAVDKLKSTEQHFKNLDGRVTPHINKIRMSGDGVRVSIF